MGRVEGKVAVITGGAAGIGRAIAALLATEGGKEVITDINEVEGRAAVAEIGYGTVFMPQDVSNEDDWRRVTSDTSERFGGLGILVNNAGVGNPNVRPENADLDQWHRVQSINLEGSFLGCKHTLPVMESGNGGSIINISSIAAFVPTAGDLRVARSRTTINNYTLY